MPVKTTLTKKELEEWRENVKVGREVYSVDLLYIKVGSFRVTRDVLKNFSKDTVIFPSKRMAYDYLIEKMKESFQKNLTRLEQEIGALGVKKTKRKT